MSLSSSWVVAVVVVVVVLGLLRLRLVVGLADCPELLRQGSSRILKKTIVKKTLTRYLLVASGIKLCVSVCNLRVINFTELTFSLGGHLKWFSADAINTPVHGY